MKKEENGCGIPNACSRNIPVWLVLLDNIPTITMYLLGAAILWPLGAGWGSAYLVYSFLSVFLFWMRICPYCHHYGTLACPCGYGIISAKLFSPKQASSGDFRNVFRRNIIVVFPSWFVPSGVGGYLLWKDFSVPRLWLFAAFCVVGYILIPLISKLVGCRNCSVKDDCPWMMP